MFLRESALIKLHPLPFPCSQLPCRSGGGGGKWPLPVSVGDGRLLVHSLCCSTMLLSEQPVLILLAGMGRFMLG